MPRLTFLSWLTVLQARQRVVMNLVMLADRRHPLAEAVLVAEVDISTGPAKWDRTKAAPEVSERAGSLRGAAHDVYDRYSGCWQ